MKRFITAVVAVGASALMLMPTGLASAASPKAHAAAYKATGRTSQGGRVVLLLASTGRRIQMTFEYQASCDSGASITDAETITASSTPGGFRGHRISRVKFAADPQKNVTAGGIPGVLDVILAGNIRLDTGNAKGTIQPTLTLANGDKCTSGNTPITWSARF
jgi:hypothetical protein